MDRKKEETHLQAFAFGKLLVLEQFLQAVSRLDLMRLIISLLSAKSRRDVDKLPLLDVIIRLVPPVNVSLNCIAIIADDETYFQLVLVRVPKWKRNIRKQGSRT